MVVARGSQVYNSPKKTQIDKAVDKLEGEIAVLQLAVAKLREQQTKAPARKPRALKAVGDGKPA